MESMITIIYGTLHDTDDILNKPVSLQDKQYPPMDVVVNDNKVRVWIDLPGIRSSDVEVYIQGDLFIVEGHKRSYYQMCDNCQTFLRVERLATPFRRIFRLAYPVLSNSIEFSFSNGVIHVSWMYKINVNI